MRPVDTFVGQPVRSLQTMLRVIAQELGESISLIPDGIYGRNTQKAVSDFQRRFGLPVTGVADTATFQRIVAEYRPANTRISAAQPLQLILNPGAVIQAGQTGYYVYLIQAMLLALAEIYGSLPGPEMTGVLDAQTQESVISFQYLSDLPQTGQVDKITWKHLALQYPLAVNHIESKNRTRR